MHEYQVLRGSNPGQDSAQDTFSDVKTIRIPEDDHPPRFSKSLFIIEPGDLRFYRFQGFEPVVRDNLTQPWDRHGLPMIRAAHAHNPDGAATSMRSFGESAGEIARAP